MSHDLRLSHRRRHEVRVGDQHYAESDVDVSASSTDLTEAWRELLSRLPNDVYGALKEAMGTTQPTRCDSVLSPGPDQDLLPCDQLAGHYGTHANSKAGRTWW